MVIHAYIPGIIANILIILTPFICTIGIILLFLRVESWQCFIFPPNLNQVWFPDGIDSFLKLLSCSQKTFRMDSKRLADLVLNPLQRKKIKYLQRNKIKHKVNWLFFNPVAGLKKVYFFVTRKAVKHI